MLKKFLSEITLLNLFMDYSSDVFWLFFLKIWLNSEPLFKKFVKNIDQIKIIVGVIATFKKKMPYFLYVPTD